MAGKRVDLLKQLVPKAVRVGILWDPDSPAATSQVRGVRAACRALGLELATFEVWQPDELETTFQAAAKWRADALFIATFGYFNSYRARVVDLAAKMRVPAMYTNVEVVTAGGLIGYAPDIIDQFRRAASHVVRILKGAKPADLPIEQPTKFELAINMKTAKALGLTIPPVVMVQATRVVE